MQEKKNSDNEAARIPRTKEFSGQIKEIAGLVKENFGMHMDFNISLLELNLKALRSMADHWHGAEEAYIASIKESYSKVPAIPVPFLNGNTNPVEEGINQIIDFRADYINAVREFSDQALGNYVSVAKKCVSDASTVFEVYVNELIT